MEGYREDIYLMPKADERLYDNMRPSPELTALLRERYPSVLIRAEPVLASEIITKGFTSSTRGS